MWRHRRIPHLTLLRICLASSLLPLVVLQCRSRSPFLIWALWEVILLLLLGLIRSPAPTLRIESAIIFYVPQAVGGLLFLASFTTSWELSGFLLLLALSVKLGLFPFHFWVVPSLRCVPPFFLFLVLVPRKLPAYLLLCRSKGLLVVVFASLLISFFLSVVQTSTKRLIVASRIGASGFLLLAGECNCFWIYFSTYSVTLFCFLYISEGIGLLSFLGLPGLPIFFGKIQLILGAPSTLFWMILVFYLLSAWYYLKWVPSSLWVRSIRI